VNLMEFDSGAAPFWGCVLRSCPPDPDLLHTLRETELASAISDSTRPFNKTNVHNVIEWLKVNLTLRVRLILHSFELMRFLRHFPNLRRSCSSTSKSFCQRVRRGWGLQVTEWQTKSLSHIGETGRKGRGGEVDTESGPSTY
jgi:hypothetical protein